MPIRWARVFRAVALVCALALAGWLGLSFGFFSHTELSVDTGPYGCRVGACKYSRSLLDILLSRPWSSVSCFGAEHVECEEKLRIADENVTCHCNHSVDAGLGP